MSKSDSVIKMIQSQASEDAAMRQREFDQRQAALKARTIIFEKWLDEHAPTIDAEIAEAVRCNKRHHLVWRNFTDALDSNVTSKLGPILQRESKEEGGLDFNQMRSGIFTAFKSFIVNRYNGTVKIDASARSPSYICLWWGNTQPTID